VSAETGPGDLLELPAFLRARVASQARVIPRIIYQTSKGRYMPASMHAVTRGCFDQNPDYDYRFFGDDFFGYADSLDCSDILFSGDDLSRPIRNVEPSSGTADLFCDLIIHDQESVYMDIDSFSCRLKFAGASL